MKMKLKDLEARKKKVLFNREGEWWLKRRALWIKLGDENTKFFCQFSKHRERTNSIWELQLEWGNLLRGFK
jgi:hypothetical protein